MGNDTTDTPQRRRSNPRSALVTVQGWSDVRKTGKGRQGASAAWLELRRNIRGAGPNKEPRGQAGKDKRKWDYRSLGYADKPFTARDYTKPISPELQKYYADRES